MSNFITIRSFHTFDQRTHKHSLQEKQSFDLFKQYQGEIPLLLIDKCLPTQGFLIKNLPNSVSVFEKSKNGIPVYLRCVQGGRIHSSISCKEVEYLKPTKIAIYAKFLLSGMPIDLEIWEVKGKADLAALKPGKLIKRYVYQS